MTMKQTFYELFKTSAVIQGIMALASLGAVIYMEVSGQDVAELLVGVLMVTVGFYFGTKNRQQA